MPGGEGINSRIAAVPFTLRNLKEDLEDVGSNFDVRPDLEFRLAAGARLSSAAFATSASRPAIAPIRPHAQAAGGDLRGRARSGRMKARREVVDVKEWDVVASRPHVAGLRGRARGLEILVFVRQAR